MISNIWGSLILAQICISKGSTLKNLAITITFVEKANSLIACFVSISEEDDYKIFLQNK